MSDSPASTETALPAIAPAIVAEAERLRGQGFAARKGRLKDIFDYLVKASAAGDTPTENMIAADVFGKTVFADGGDDATIRVYIHRLRTRLDAHYREHPNGERPRLVLPKGSYKFQLQATKSAAQTPQSQSRAATQSWLRLWAGLATLGLIVMGALWLGARNGPAAPTPISLWQPHLNSPAPTVIVVGDYYIYQPSPNEYGAQQLVRDFSINSANDLSRARNRQPEIYREAENIDLHYLPIASAHALAQIAPVFTMVGHTPPAIIQASRVSAATLKDYNIIYVGLISGLGYLSSPTFANSHFVTGDNYDQIIDLETETSYQSSEISGVSENADYLDYGYIAQFTGPGERLITIVAGTRDTGLQGISDVLGDAALSANIGNLRSADGYVEALFEVRGADRENLRERELTIYRGGLPEE